MTHTTDIRLLRVEKQLASAIGMLRRATDESEAFHDQSLAERLTYNLIELELLHEALMTGRRPRRLPPPTVRI